MSKLSEDELKTLKMAKELVLETIDILDMN